MKVKDFLSKPVGGSAAVIAVLALVWLVIAGTRSPDARVAAEPQRKDSVTVSDAGKHLLDIKRRPSGFRHLKALFKPPGKSAFHWTRRFISARVFQDGFGKFWSRWETEYPRARQWL